VLGPKPALKEGNPEEDLTADKANAQAAALYKVSDATGQMNLTKVADSSPFALELLISDDCFVLDNGLCGKIYIWKGRKADEKERQAALQVAEGFISRMQYALNTQVRRCSCPSLLLGLLLWPLTPQIGQEGQERLGHCQEQPGFPLRPIQWESPSQSFKMSKYLLFSKRMLGSTPLGTQRTGCSCSG
uniref:macrophage-capping protein-like n=2 Tax=Piliocolobus tephrosceles TaxID=591936 RepID=UPI000E6B06F6